MCRTGPFEGLFVSSVEFCKHIKFDDRKDHARDNRTGTQSPPGQQGAPGIKGTQVPPRITQLINGTNVYLVTKSSIDQPNAQVQSFCQPGDFVINGGYLYQGNVGDATIFPFNKPITTPDGAGLEVALSFGFPSSDLTVYAYCFDNSP